MHRRYGGRRWLLVLALAAASACGGNTTLLPGAEDTPGIGKEEGRPVGSTASKTKKPSGPAAASKKPAVSSPAAPTAEPSPNPYTMPFQTDPSVLVDAVLTPVCADNGTKMTLTVKTNPEASVGYQAIYSDNGGGGPAPYGSGYGGNGKGLADDQGRFKSSWVISPSAPDGYARVDVVVGWAGKFGYEALTFHVGPEANCS